MIARNVVIDDKIIIIQAEYYFIVSILLRKEEYELLEMIKNLKEFNPNKSLLFWDNFNHDLYKEVLIEKLR